MRTLPRWVTRLRQLPLGVSFNVHYWGYYPGCIMPPPWATVPAESRHRQPPRGTQPPEQHTAPGRDGEEACPYLEALA